jgi:hypothetical protein
MFSQQRLASSLGILALGRRKVCFFQFGTTLSLLQMLMMAVIMAVMKTMRNDLDS